MTKTPMLDKLASERIFGIDKAGDNKFTFTEFCDYYFKHECTQADIIQLSNELLQLAYAKEDRETERPT